MGVSWEVQSHLCGRSGQKESLLREIKRPSKPRMPFGILACAGTSGPHGLNLNNSYNEFLHELKGSFGIDSVLGFRI